MVHPCKPADICWPLARCNRRKPHPLAILPRPPSPRGRVDATEGTSGIRWGRQKDESQLNFRGVQNVRTFFCWYSFSFSYVFFRFFVILSDQNGSQFVPHEEGTVRHPLGAAEGNYSEGFSQIIKTQIKRHRKSRRTVRCREAFTTQKTRSHAGHA